mmetsp:Transcript_11930/g.27850  ORF Transcript_11930/g.27850 Transcript_11930/m.27850 type:complete len:605 (-) Transcript_11930:2-1816(-)
MESIQKAVTKWARGPEISYDELDVDKHSPYGQVPPPMGNPPLGETYLPRGGGGPGWPGRISVSLAKPLGIILQELPHGGVVVGALQPQGNAEASKQVQLGDLLLMVGNADVATSRIDEVESLIYNTPHAEVMITLSRAGAMPAPGPYAEPSTVPQLHPPPTQPQFNSSLDDTVVMDSSFMAKPLASTYDLNMQAHSPAPTPGGCGPSTPRSNGASSNSRGVSFPQPANPAPPGPHDRPPYGSPMPAHPFPDEYQVDLSKPMGIVFQSREPLPGAYVQSIQDGSPARACGQIHVGDFLLAVGPQDVSQMDFDDIMLVVETASASLVHLRFRAASGGPGSGWPPSAPPRGQEQWPAPRGPSFAAPTGARTPPMPGGAPSWPQPSCPTPRSSTREARPQGEFDVQLAKPLGLSLEEGPAGGIFVDGLQEGGSAALEGTVRRGDRLVAVDGRPVGGADVNTVVGWITHGGNATAALTFFRGPAMARAPSQVMPAYPPPPSLAGCPGRPGAPPPQGCPGYGLPPGGTPRSFHQQPAGYAQPMPSPCACNSMPTPAQYARTASFPAAPNSSPWGMGVPSPYGQPAAWPGQQGAARYPQPCNAQAYSFPRH